MINLGFTAVCVSNNSKVGMKFNLADIVLQTLVHNSGLSGFCDDPAPFT